MFHLLHFINLLCVVVVVFLLLYDVVVDLYIPFFVVGRPQSHRG